MFVFCAREYPGRAKRVGFTSVEERAVPVTKQPFSFIYTL